MPYKTHTAPEVEEDTEPEVKAEEVKTPKHVSAEEAEQPQTAADDQAAAVEAEIQAQAGRVSRVIASIIVFWRKASWQKKSILGVSFVEFALGAVTIGNGGFGGAFFGLVIFIIALFMD